MGRLHHLRETFLKNIADNQDYPNLEFVLLNYSSPDGMDDWARQNLQGLISSGRVVYYRTECHKHFHVAHAKNVAQKLASGDIICAVDADNFTGQGFARFLGDLFAENSRRVVHGHWDVRPGLTGRIAVLKRYFFLAGGYDESLRGWGYEDYNLVQRLYNFGLDKVLIREEGFLGVIRHGDEERVRFYPPGCQDRGVTNKVNIRLSLGEELGQAVANRGVHWGRDRVTMNFGTDIIEV